MAHPDQVVVIPRDAVVLDVRREPAGLTHAEGVGVRLPIPLLDALLHASIVPGRRAVHILRTDGVARRPGPGDDRLSSGTDRRCTPPQSSSPHPAPPSKFT
ncbi:hypothetical protein DXU92_03680 [Brachybacterium saurashtrense]|uniref:Uncharacterized protein n=1 Tax=Brachybacterium saurashtrense TaxID=556288 RepID=A0A345YQP5_9MICO|nr:hypothetical protein DWV08_11930 [Brachybacterium saurashtrense]RRR23987.1 hypothetical protein DXU92_03680 [Brachybacterium saurashtrense]